MRVAFVASEAVPFAKVGGLADVVGSLPPHLVRQGLHLTVYLPGAGPAQAEDCGEARFTWAGTSERVTLRRVRHEGVHFRFVDLPEFRDRPIYEGAPDIERYLRFDLAVDAALRARPPQVVHLHDWPTALIALLLRQRRSKVRSILTLHNLAHQGLVDPEWFFNATGLPRSLFSLDGLEFHGQVNLLKGGLGAADVITTVSPTYAREIQSPEHGEGLDGVLRAHGGKMLGVLNGIDTHAWDPACDPALPENYRSVDDPGKEACRVALAHELGISGPVLGVVSRLVWQKGIDLILDAVPRLLEVGYSLCILGSGDAALERECAEAAGRHPGRVAFRAGYNETLAHRIYAGAEAFVMPSRFEPCGLSQRIAMRYGTVPIVRATGGLRDTVRDGVDGIHFACAHPEGLLSALCRLRHGPLHRDTLAAAAMAAPCGWEASAAAYQRLYAGQSA